MEFHENIPDLCAVLDPFQNGGEVGSVLGTMLPTLRHDPVTWRRMAKQNQHQEEEEGKSYLVDYSLLHFKTMT